MSNTIHGVQADRRTGGDLTPRGYEQLTGIAAATSLTVPLDAKIAIIDVEAVAVRWRDDGTDPTAAIGMNLAQLDTFIYTGDLNAIKFIEVAVGAILNVSYYS